MSPMMGNPEHESIGKLSKRKPQEGGRARKRARQSTELGRSGQLADALAGQQSDAAGVPNFAAKERRAGQELPYREEMEAAFGEDFSGVRVRYGSRPAPAARGAANGEEVTFASSQPDRKLVAHELVHVVQARRNQNQEDGAQQSSAAGGKAGAAEQEANQVATRVAKGEPAGSIRQASAGSQYDGGPQTDDVAGGVGALAEYQAVLRELYNKIDQQILAEGKYMLSKGVPEKVVAEWSVKARNQAKEHVRNWDALKRWAEERNLAKYGDKVGPNYSQLKNGDPAHNIKPKTDGQIIEGAGRANATVNRWAGRLRIAGRVLIAIDLGLTAYKIASAPTEDRPKVFIKEATGLAGALAGGWAGAKGGAWAGAGIGAWFEGVGAAPGALIGGLIGGIGGAITGGWAGHAAGDWLVDELYPVEQTQFESAGE